MGLSVDALCWPAKLVLGADAEAVACYAGASKPTEIIPFAYFHLAAALALAWLIGGGAGCSAGGACAPSNLHHSPHASKVSDDPTFRAGAAHP